MSTSASIRLFVFLLDAVILDLPSTTQLKKNGWWTAGTGKGPAGVCRCHGFVASNLIDALRVFKVILEMVADLGPVLPNTDNYDENFKYRHDSS
jgi:hypothetical protein